MSVVGVLADRGSRTATFYISYISPGVRNAFAVAGGVKWEKMEKAEELNEKRAVENFYPKTANLRFYGDLTVCFLLCNVKSIQCRLAI